MGCHYTGKAFTGKDDTVSPDAVKGGATFNIGSQEGVISNVGGDMNVYGGQHAAIILPVAELRRELESLSKALGSLSLPPSESHAAELHMKAAQEELGRSQPDRHTVAARMEQITKILKRSGALTAAGLAVLNPLHGIAALLGPLGSSILKALSP
jgi:hypothetical protein